MKDNTCPRCFSKFYSAITGVDINCPFCGFAIRYIEINRREEDRTIIQRNCNLLKGDMMVSAQTVDISKIGVCVVMTGSAPFEKDDTLYVVIKDFEIDTDAKVIWVKGFNDFMFKAGLRFC